MTRDNKTASQLVHFPNATLLKAAIVGVAIIPGAYPNQPARTRIITTGSFPVDVAESLEDVLICWRGDVGVEEARRQTLEARVLEMKMTLRRLQSITDPQHLLEEVQGLDTK